MCGVLFTVRDANSDETPQGDFDTEGIAPLTEYHDYPLWAHHMEESLRGQGLWYIIENELPRQVSDASSKSIVAKATRGNSG